MRHLKTGFRRLLLSTSALVAGGLLGAPGWQAMAQVAPIASVNGAIVDSDGTRILYAPATDPHALNILNLSNSSTTAISLAPTYTPGSGFLTPLGAAFNATDNSSTNIIFNYNGSLTNVSTGLVNSGGLTVAGQYAAFLVDEI